MNAQKTYAKVQKETLSGREIEARVLQKASSQLRRLVDLPEGNDRNKSTEAAIRYNLRVWDVFQADWESPESSLAESLRIDLLRLSSYVHKTSLEILAYGDNDKILSIVNINDCLVAGLTSNSVSVTTAPEETAEV